jgi:hypothetical protein
MLILRAKARFVFLFLFPGINARVSDKLIFIKPAKQYVKGLLK